MMDTAKFPLDGTDKLGRFLIRVYGRASWFVAASIFLVDKICCQELSEIFLGWTSKLSIISFLLNQTARDESRPPAALIVYTYTQARLEHCSVTLHGLRCRLAPYADAFWI